jgi:hypothetical protein
VGEHERLRAERDELLEAAKDVVEYLYASNRPAMVNKRLKLQAAIRKAEAPE